MHNPFSPVISVLKYYPGLSKLGSDKAGPSTFFWDDRMIWLSK